MRMLVKVFGRRRSRLGSTQTYMFNSYLCVLFFMHNSSPLGPISIKELNAA